MQPSADYLRSYSLHANSPATSSPLPSFAATSTPPSPSVASSSMPPSTPTRQSMDQVSNSNQFSINYLSTTQQLQQSQYPQAFAAVDAAAAVASYQNTFSHHSHYSANLYNHYSTGLEGYGMMPTTHIPLDSFQQHHTSEQHLLPHLQHSVQQQQQLRYPPRPQPTRPHLLTGTNPSSPLAARSHSSPSNKDKVNNNSSNASNNNNNNNNTNNNNSPQETSMSPENRGPISPTATNPDPTRSSGTPKFRYPSGTTTNNSVQSASSANSDRGGGAATPNSTLSSRDGTPIPSGENIKEPAPNIDISRVKIDLDLPASQLRSPCASDNSQNYPNPYPNPYTSYHSVVKPELTKNETGMPGMGYHPVKSEPTKSEPGMYQHPLHPFGPPLKHPELMDQSGSLGHSITLPQRGKNTLNSRGHHGTGKIGRRPAHLPKNLKHDDPSLPHGWKRLLKQRKHGKQQGRWDVYIYSPCGVKFASKKKLTQFIEKNNPRDMNGLPLDADDFDFTPYGRHIEARAAAMANSAAAGNATSRHNSSGSTGSDGTLAGSSPASIANYSPTHSSAYIPQSVGLSGQMGLISSHPGLTCAPSFSEFETIKSQLDMKSPPNSVAPGSDYMPYQHLGRGHHYPIVNKDLNSTTCSADFLPSDMGELLGSNYNGFHAVSTSGSTLTSSATSMTCSRVNIDDDTPKRTAIDLVNNGSCSPGDDNNSHEIENNFSIGRVMMNSLNEEQMYP